MSPTITPVTPHLPNIAVITDYICVTYRTLCQYCGNLQGYRSLCRIWLRLQTLGYSVDQTLDFRYSYA